MLETIPVANPTTVELLIANRNQLMQFRANVWSALRDLNPEKSADVNASALCFLERNNLTPETARAMLEARS
jgi:hypothetical protein